VTSNKLVKMANQIATNFDTGDEAAAVAGTADHLQRFWTPDMRREILAYADKSGAELNKIAALAIAELGRNRAA
jgi:formate dehydrogenase subunit delta